MPSPAVSPPSSTPRPAASSKPRASYREADRQGVRRPPWHRRRADRRPDRRQHAKRRATIRGLRYTPAGAFGSARFKLKGLDKNRAEYERLIEVFKAHDIGYFFYNGGNDSMDTAHKVSQIGEQLGYPMTCIGVPKTVDNDLPLPTAARVSARWPSTSRSRRCEARARRGLDGAHLDQGVRARSDGPACRLDRRGRRPRRPEGQRCAAHHPVSGNRLRAARRSWRR